MNILIEPDNSNVVLLGSIIVQGMDGDLLGVIVDRVRSVGDVLELVRAQPNEVIDLLVIETVRGRDNVPLRYQCASAKVVPVHGAVARIVFEADRRNPRPRACNIK